MLNPEQIPQIDSDLDALAEHGRGFRRVGQGFGDAGALVHSEWQALQVY